MSGAGYKFKSPGRLVSDGSGVWVANSGNGTVTEVNAATGALVQDLSGSPYTFNGRACPMKGPSPTITGEIALTSLLRGSGRKCL